MSALENLLLAVSASDGGYNIGALTVAKQLIAHDRVKGLAAVKAATMVGITGAELWCLYNDACLEDIAATMRCLLNGTAVDRLASMPGSGFYVEGVS